MENRFENSTGAAGGSEREGAGASMAGEARETLQRTTEQAGRMAGQVRDQVKSGINSGMDAAAGQVSSVAAALRQTGETLRAREPGPASDYTLRAAEMVEGISETLRSKDFDQVMGDMETFARRNPAVFLGSAFVIGFMAARFFKSSGREAGFRSETGSYGSTSYDSYSHSQGRAADRGFDADNLPPAVTASGRLRAEQYPHLGNTGASSAMDTDHDEETETTRFATGGIGE